jgi:5-methyltetrahydropteroyltriglutamate--homocysteine methyltransferase
MKRNDARVLTTHAGALPRPDELIRAVAAPAGNELSEPLDGLLTRLVPSVVKRQVDAGIDVVNDGEYGKPRPGRTPPPATPSAIPHASVGP